MVYRGSKGIKRQKTRLRLHGVKPASAGAVSSADRTYIKLPAWMISAFFVDNCTNLNFFFTNIAV